MADQPAPTSAPGKVKGWLKTVIGTLAGLLSGAVLMYLTPLIDRVIKPAKPLANFGYQADGLNVTFHNRSSGGSSGWWDFGDGSPLEPATPGQEIVTHTYPRPGDFTAKLTLRNLIGDEQDRAVVVRLEAPQATEPPRIEALEAEPISPGSYAPATFKLVSKVRNANLFVWDLGDDRPLEISTDKDHGQEKLATFDKPGAYVVKLAAVSGTQAAVKSDIIQVNVPPAGAVSAVLCMTDQATRVEKKDPEFTFAAAFPLGSRDAVHAINLQAPAEKDCVITDVCVKSAKTWRPLLQGKTEIALDAAAVGVRGARNLRFVLAPDRRSVRLTGELVQESGMSKRSAPPPPLALPVKLIQEKRSPANRCACPVAATLSVPGSALLTMPPLPPDWVDARRQARLELREGDRVVWQESQLSKSALVTLQNKKCVVTTAASGNHVRIDIVEVPAGPVSNGN